jgi:hypothetical protein
MPRLCRNFNNDDGCEVGCPYVHQLYCTNPRCVNAGKQNTHTLENCGQKGGGAHEQYIAAKKASQAGKVPVAPSPKPEPISLAQVEREIEVSKAYKRGEYDNSSELLYALVSRSHPDLAGKITGMFREALSAPELRDLILKPELLAENVSRAIEVLEISKKMMSESI